MKYKLAIIDKRSPNQAIESLSKHIDDLLLFETEGLTYYSISCHPDVFICYNDSNLIVAPNAPSALFDFMEKYHISFSLGKKPVGESLKDSTLYNCVSTQNKLFHKKGFTDESVLKECADKKFINVPQAYTRCSLIHIRDDNYITSDKGIEKSLHSMEVECFYFDPSQIRIHDHKNGFFGGAAGMMENKLFTIGCIEKHLSGKKFLKFLDEKKIELVSLCNDYLYDGGGIFFIESN